MSYIKFIPVLTIHDDNFTQFIGVRFYTMDRRKFSRLTNLYESEDVPYTYKVNPSYRLYNVQCGATGGGCKTPAQYSLEEIIWTIRIRRTGEVRTWSYNSPIIQNTYSPKDLRDIAKKGSLIPSKKSPRQRTGYMKVWQVCTPTNSEGG